ncbi:MULTISPECIES: hypothetical protein [unclassified Leptolyngbya]|uniref:hypothetical protein n=1 Tax=unclassified Leptolyngbya TaxID=2650499 RepID=UPI003D3245F0
MRNVLPCIWGSQTFRIKSAFLSGYFFARRQSGIPKTLQEQQFFEFQAWVERKVNLPHSQPWEKVIRYFSPDETTSLRDFLSSSMNLPNLKLLSQSLPNSKIQSRFKMEME